MEKNKVGELCLWLYSQPKGKKLLEELKMALANDPVFPRSAQYLDQYGGGEMYAAFRSGQSSIIRLIELHAVGFRDKENAALAAQQKG